MRIFVAAYLVMLLCAPALAAEESIFEVANQDDRVLITSAGRPVATYVFRDPQIPRPYFCDLYAPGGARVTRRHPPVEGEDLTDHEHLHPGMWMSFGDLDGVDFWRNQAVTEHVEFITPPTAEGVAVRFAVRNRYRDGDRVVCEEQGVRSIEKTSEGFLFRWSSTFRGERPFYFGDQEEMGLGLRMHTPLSVAQGGEILNSDGLRNEKQAWGKPADWCLYRGRAGADHVGVLLMPSPKNFRRAWFHCRDYGLVVGNPFGRNAFTGGEASRIEVAAGQPFTLGYAVLLFQHPADRPLDAGAVFKAAQPE